MRHGLATLVARMLVGVFLALTCVCPLLCATPKDVHACCKHGQSGKSTKPCGHAEAADRVPVAQSVPVAAAIVRPDPAPQLLAVATVETSLELQFRPTQPHSRLILRI
jgi:hypothetical protein